MMKIALLACDYVNDDLIQIFGDLEEMFIRALRGVCNAEIDVYKVYEELRYPEVEKGYDLFLITGSRRSVNDNSEWVRSLILYVNNIIIAGEKVIGLCFGHQVIAKAIGGEVSSDAHGWNLGLRAVDFHQNIRNEKDLNKKLFVLFNHREYVVSLPQGAAVLAGNSHCPIQMFRYLNALGFQGHPEYELAYQEALMHRAPLVGEQQRDDAIQRNAKLKSTNDDLFKYLLTTLNLL